MSDGTTATTLAPSEDEMSKVAETFGKMRDAVIGASQLASEVAELRRSVERLRTDVEEYRASNRWLDQQVTELREQRDAANRNWTSTEKERDAARAERDYLQTHAENQREQLARLNEQMTMLRKERDDAEYRAMELGEENMELRDRIKAIDVALHPVVKEAEAANDKELANWSDVTRDAVANQPRSEGGQFQPKPSYEEETGSHSF